MDPPPVEMSRVDEWHCAIAHLGAQIFGCAEVNDSARRDSQPQVKKSTGETCHSIGDPITQVVCDKVNDVIWVIGSHKSLERNFPLSKGLIKGVGAG